MLREKHLECTDLEGENERLTQLVEKLENENYHLQNQVRAFHICQHEKMEGIEFFD